MEFLILVALIGLIYLVYLVRQDFKDHSVRIESQMQRITEVAIKNQDKKISNNNWIKFDFKYLKHCWK